MGGGRTGCHPVVEDTKAADGVLLFLLCLRRSPRLCQERERKSSPRERSRNRVLPNGALPVPPSLIQRRPRAHDTQSLGQCCGATKLRARQARSLPIGQRNFRSYLIGRELIEILEAFYWFMTVSYFRQINMFDLLADDARVQCRPLIILGVAPKLGADSLSRSGGSMRPVYCQERDVYK